MKLLQKEKLSYQILTVGIILFTVFFLYKCISNTVVGLHYPNEYREAVNIEFTKSILNGENPYSLHTLQQKGAPAPCYLYPFIYCYTAAVLSFLFGGNVVLTHYLLSIISMLVSAALAAIMINRYTKTSVAPALGFVLMLFCHWRFGYVSAAPDSFGLMLTILTLYLVVDKRIKKKALLAAIGTVLLFYTKQYFITIAASIFIYMWFYLKKEAWKYFVYCVVMTVASAILITFVYPLYWTYSVYLLKGFETYFSMEQFKYVFEQFLYMGTIFFCLFLVLIASLIAWVIKRRAEGLKADKQHVNIKENSPLTLFTIQIVIQGICLLYFGLNDGSYLTYYLQMWIPSVIIVALICMEQIVMIKPESIYFCVYAAVCIITVYFGSKRLPFVTLDKEAVANWDRAEQLISEYESSEGQQVYYAPTLAYFAFDREKHPYDTGHINITRDAFYPYWVMDESAQRLYPFTGDIFERHMEYREKLRKQAENGELKLITYVDDTDYTFTDAFLAQNQYELLCTIPLRTGNMEYATKFWVLKNSNH